jgi:HSP20 family protein
MLLRPWEPFPAVGDLRREVDRLFRETLGDAARGEPREPAGWVPPVDFSETEDAYVLRFDLPGVPKDAVELTIEDYVLTLAGERKAANVAEGERAIRRERVTGRFHRSLALPGTADTSQVDAKYHDGVLEITIAKSKETKPHKIDIAGSE